MMILFFSFLLVDGVSFVTTHQTKPIYITLDSCVQSENKLYPSQFSPYLLSFFGCVLSKEYILKRKDNILYVTYIYIYIYICALLIGRK